MKDLSREKMKPMGISSDVDEDVDIVRSTTIFPPITSQFFKQAMLDSQVGRTIILCALGLILYILVSLPQTHQALNGSGMDPNDAQHIYFRPRNLYSMLQKRIVSAKENAALSSLTVSAPTYVVDKEIEFMIFVAETDMSSMKDKTTTLTEDSTVSSGSTTSSSSSAAVDPFDKVHLDQRLVVTEVEPLHTLVLNKFNTVEGHTLLITNDYQYQGTPLTYTDLEAWYWCIDQIGGVGFYNSALVAGASQRHKHMQLVPLGAVAALRPSSATHALPVDDVIAPKIASGDWRPYTPHGETRYSLNSNNVHSTSEGSSIYAITSSPYTTVYVPADSAAAEAFVMAEEGEGEGGETATVGSMAKTALSASHRTSVISSAFYTLPQFSSFRHSVAVLLDPTSWKDLNQRIDPAYRMPSYSVYLELVYEDLLASAGVTLPPCSSNSDSSTSSNNVDGNTNSNGFRGSNSNTGGNGDNTNEDEGVGYCQGYNLVMTSQWMMVIPRVARDFEDGLVSVNGFGFIGMMLLSNTDDKDKDQAGQGVHGLMEKHGGPMAVLNAVTYPS